MTLSRVAELVTILAGLPVMVSASIYLVRALLLPWRAPLGLSISGTWSDAMGGASVNIRNQGGEERYVDWVGIASPSVLPRLRWGRRVFGRGHAQPWIGNHLSSFETVGDREYLTLRPNGSSRFTVVNASVELAEEWRNQRTKIYPVVLLADTRVALGKPFRLRTNSNIDGCPAGVPNCERCLHSIISHIDESRGVWRFGERYRKCSECNCRRYRGRE